MISKSTLLLFEPIVGQDFVKSTDDLNLPKTWKIRPEIEVSPGSVEEVIAIVIAAEKAGTAIIPIGGSQQLETCYPPDRPTIFLSMRRMNRVLDHQPDDLTITCEAGVTVAQVEETLRLHGQTLALDGPLPAQSTLGGMVAAATAGVRRLAYGTPRDSLIGMRAVMSGGVEIKGGGKVVKNVAGYDVCKLFTGSWGSVGILTELSFKVRPLPEAKLMLAWKTSDITSTVQTGLILHHARLTPTTIMAATNLMGCPALIVGVEGAAGRVAWQGEEFSRKVAEAGIDSHAVELTAAQVAYLNDWPAIVSGKSNVAARVACLPSELAEVISRISALPNCHILADCAVGTFHCTFENFDCISLEAFRGFLPARSNCVWTQLDLEGDYGTRNSSWVEAREDRLLQTGMKRAVDPLGTFSPGRFPGG
jgi:glycolate oxidase FAD binding subunit